MKRIALFVFLISMTVPAAAQRGRSADGRAMTEPERQLRQSLNQVMRNDWKDGFEEFFPTRSAIQEVEITENTVILRFNQIFSRMPIRLATREMLNRYFRPHLGTEHDERLLVFEVGEALLEELIPRPDGALSGAPLISPSTPPLVRLDNPAAPIPENGLFGRHLLIAASHGWMYDSLKSIRWEWQRARIFNTVEDMHTVSYILPWLIPMLERAGGVVFHARERDWQMNEVVLDDGDGTSRSYTAGHVRKVGQWRLSREPGFAGGLAPYPDAFNPHEAGHVHIKSTRNRVTGRFEWVPNIPEDGEYGVYVSYRAGPDRAPDARYTVHHLGGQTSFLVNQQMGGNTWVWLGRFRFARGDNRRMGRVELDNQSAHEGTIVCADAVKFGGGMGDIIRGGVTSGYPRYAEGSRYWLQYAGAPAELSYKMGWETGYEGPDYTDDFTGRVEWANVLRGKPFGPNKDPDYLGLGVPIDLFYSMHTDAGIDDGIVGTLMIYYSQGDDGQAEFGDGRTRQINRDLADRIQTEIVDDIRALYSSTWTRRALSDANYSESRRANMPSCLIELMSHQNFNDMKYGLDPRFQRDVSRSTYKGMLRFLAQEYGFDPVVQPLPPSHLMVRRTGPESIHVTWQPVEDPLEPTASPTGYLVYTRIEDGGFDNGVYTERPEYRFEGLDSETLYSFRVEAVNSGGRSMPSETLACSPGHDGRPNALIVAGFDRIGAPRIIDEPGFKGFDPADRGVGYLYYFGRTGWMYDYDPESKFVSNDAPGHGASAGDIEFTLEKGNTFDYAARHGKAFRECGWRFDSVSNEAVADGLVDLSDYRVVNWMLGKQRLQPVPTGFVSSGTADRMEPMFRTLTGPMQAALAEYADQGGRLLISGAYVGTDLATEPEDATRDHAFLRDVLRIEHVTNHGSNTNRLTPQPGLLFDGMENLRIASGLGEDGVYGVELPDAIDPVKDSGGQTALRYQDRNFSAAVIHESTPTGARTIVFGFPLETLIGQEQRAELLRRSLEFLDRP